MTLTYLIWSWEHRAWWRPDCSGYTTSVEDAGRYTRDQAADIVLDHIPPGEEVAVRESIAAQLAPHLLESSRK